MFVCLLRDHCQSSVITILVLELLDSNGLCKVWSPDVLQCGRDEPRSRLDTFSRLEAPFSWEIKLSRS